MKVFKLDSMRWLAFGIVVALVAIAFTVGILLFTYDSGGTGGNGGNGSQSIATDTDLAGSESEAPNWNLLMSDGGILELNSLRGSFVVVSLMQTGECVPCQQQTSHLKDLYADHEGRLEILSLSLVLSDTVARVAQHKEQNGIQWQVGLDTQGVFGSYFNARSVPTLIIIDDEGFFR
jgi:peroxiredoxin